MPSKTFCVLPWFSRENSYTTTPCCLLDLNYDIDQVRKDLLNGIETPACNKCWDIESQGKQSRRQIENTFLDWKLDRDIEKIEEDCRQGKSNILLYQVYLSNLCNQACVTCNSGLSSKWAEIEKRMQIKPAATHSVDLEDFKIDFKNAQRINLLGGEPLFDPGAITILKRLIENKNTDCFISFVTNGSIKLGTELKSLLSQFKNLNICISIDGIGRVFEYMRWPGKWDELLKNINDYKSVTDNFSVSYTVSAVNVLYYRETIDWFKKSNLNFSYNIVYHPSWASLATMPVALKNHVTDPFFNEFKLINGQEISVDKFVEQLDKQDAAKRTNWKSSLPELAELLSQANQSDPQLSSHTTNLP